MKSIGVVGPLSSGMLIPLKLLAAAGVSLGTNIPSIMTVGNRTEECWEHPLLINVEAGVFKTLGKDPYGSFPFESGWQESVAASHFKRDLAGVLAWEFGAYEEWAWGTSLATPLLPLWSDVLKEQGMTPVFIVAIRNPQAVAVEIIAEGRVSLKQGLRLWLYHMLSIVETVRLFPYFVFSYDGFLQDPENECRQLLQFLGKEENESLMELARTLADKDRERFVAMKEGVSQPIDINEKWMAVYHAISSGRILPESLPMSLDEYEELSRFFSTNREERSPLWLEKQQEESGTDE